MTAFRIWAPYARRVALVWKHGPTELTPVGNGYFEADVPGATPGTDYLYSLNGGEPVPDPRSAWQPGGISGPSRVVDPRAFTWTDAHFEGIDLASTILYELHVGTFSPEGTFDGAVRRLDHLVHLGVNAVEVMPVAEFSGSRGWGYDGVFPYAPHAAYGDPDALRRFVNECHARNLGVVLDVVYNHLGPAGNCLPRFGPYFTDFYKTPWGTAFNLDGPDSDAVRAFIRDNVIMWFRDYHVDALRLDAVHAIIDTSAVHILEDLANDTEAFSALCGRKLALIAESAANDPRIVRDQTEGGYGIDAQWNDDFHHALHAVLTGEHHGFYGDFGTLKDLATAIAESFVYAGRYSAFRRRTHGRTARGLPADRFVVYQQNHDQVGNRALGERTSALLSPGLLRVAAALVLTSPYVPLLFQGEEWGATTPFFYFTDHADPELGRAVREGRAREFAEEAFDAENVPDPQAPDTFLRSKLDWAEAERPPHAELREWYRRLIELRRTRPLASRTAANARVEFDEAERWLLVWRGTIVVACNLSAEPRALPVTAMSPRVLLASTPEFAFDGEALTLGAESVVIFE